MSGPDARPAVAAGAGAVPGLMGRAVERLAFAMAILGGLVLCALVLLICASVLGRGLDTFAHSDLAERAVPTLAAAILGTDIGPVRGDFELVEAGVAFAIFAFLPICQLRGGHASVDVFTDRLPPRAQALLIAFWELVLSAVIVLIAWRLFAGLLGKRASGETTFLLQFPVWWAYGASFVAACGAVLVALHCAAARAVAVTAGRDGGAPPGGTNGDTDRGVDADGAKTLR